MATLEPSRSPTDPATPPRPFLQWMRLLLPWAVALLLAAIADPWVCRWIEARGFPDYFNTHCLTLMTMVRSPGIFTWQLPVILLVALLPAWRWRGSLLIGFASGYAALLTSLLKWGVGRYRPFILADDHLVRNTDAAWTPFANGIHGLFNTPSNLSFPSGHTSIAFAAATALAIILPKWRWLFYLIATLTGISRVIQGAHYTSDAVGAAAVGAIAAGLAWSSVRLLERLLVAGR